jgi:hypothetical protein
MGQATQSDEAARTRIEAEVFRKLVAHLQRHPEVQNIDLMNLAYFCRNCLSRWYRDAAAAEGLEMDETAARAIVYGMPYADYKARHQEPPDAAKLAAFREAEAKATR